MGCFESVTTFEFPMEPVDLDAFQSTLFLPTHRALLIEMTTARDNLISIGIRPF